MELVSWGKEMLGVGKEGFQLIGKDVGKEFLESDFGDGNIVFWNIRKAAILGWKKPSNIQNVQTFDGVF